jgi:hypothetical protein
MGIDCGTRLPNPKDTQRHDVTIQRLIFFAFCKILALVWSRGMVYEIGLAFDTLKRRDWLFDPS